MKLTNVLLMVVVLILGAIGFEHHQTMVRERNSIQQIANDTHNELARQDKQRRFAACVSRKYEEMHVGADAGEIIQAKMNGIDTSALEKADAKLEQTITKDCTEDVVVVPSEVQKELDDSTAALKAAQERDAATVAAFKKAHPDDPMFKK